MRTPISPEAEPPRLSRRILLVSGITAFAAGCSRSSNTNYTPATPHTPPLFNQPGHVLSAVFHGEADRASMVTRAIAAMNKLSNADIYDAELQVRIGLGPRIVAAANPSLPGAEELPPFRRENLQPQTAGGDVLILAGSDNPAAPTAVLSTLADAVGKRPSWEQRGFYSPRNVLGFHDGIENPRSASEINQNVRIGSPSALADTTIAVIRRLRIDMNRWHEFSLKEQEQTVGRRRGDGKPLSGEEVDLAAKDPDGEYRIPAMSHVRRAHPLAAGTGRMLRRGYNYDNGPGDQGLLFISFQNALRTFTATQQRMDEGDALMELTTATASGTFLMLPIDARGHTTLPAVLTHQ